MSKSLSIEILKNPNLQYKSRFLQISSILLTKKNISIIIVADMYRELVVGGYSKAITESGMNNEEWKGDFMATTVDFIEFVCGQIDGTGAVTYKKMFGEYMVYVNGKPVLLVCDNTVFVKALDCIAQLMQNAEKGIPYKGAKEHYILDIDNGDSSREIVNILEKVTPLPKPRKKKA